MGNSPFMAANYTPLMKSLEQCHNAFDVARELRQSWDDRMDYLRPQPRVRVAGHFLFRLQVVEAS